MNFIKGTEKESKYSQEFVDAIEEFTPIWIERLIPFYQEAKDKGVDYLQLESVLWLGELEDGMETYEKNGVAYYLNSRGGHSWLSFWGGGTKYTRASFYYDFKKNHPEICDDWTKNVQWWSFGIYIRRYTNRKPEYCFFDKACDQYFQNLTGDKEAHLTIGNECFIYFNETGKNYIFSHKLLD